MNFKLGKNPPEADPHTLRMSSFVPETLPAPEEKRGWEYAVPDAVWAQSMLGNDQVGNCVIAMLLHYIMLAEASAGRPVPQFTTADGIALYSAITGYDPSQTQPDGSNPTDQGTSMTAALAYMVSTGYKGYKFLAWAQFDFRNRLRLQQAIDLFGAALVGFTVTQEMMDAFNAKKPWNAPYGTNSLGGHGCPFPGFGSQGDTLITWAMRQQTDPGFLPKMADEAYVAITESWLNAAQETPLGIDLAALQADMAALKA